jgi:hypothetical protein
MSEEARQRTRDLMEREGIPSGSDHPDLIALGSPPLGLPKVFVLVRHEDETGVSTEQGADPGQVVAWGVEFPDGPTVIRWCVSDVRQTAVFASLDDVRAIHGHSGKTEVRFAAPPTASLSGSPEEREA